MKSFEALTLQAVPSPEKKEKPRTNEKKEKLRVMRQLFDLGEEETHRAQELDALSVSDYQITRAAFEEPGKEAPTLHEADEKDRLVNWLNDWKEELREHIRRQGRTAPMIRDELLKTAQGLSALVKEVCQISLQQEQSSAKQSDHSGASLSVIKGGKTSVREMDIAPPLPNSDPETILRWLNHWQNAYEQLIRDLYAWTIPQKEWMDTATDLQQKRALQDLARIEAEYETPAAITYALVQKRLELSRLVRSRAHVTKEDWDEYLENPL